MAKDLFEEEPIQIASAKPTAKAQPKASAEFSAKVRPMGSVEKRWQGMLKDTAAVGSKQPTASSETPMGQDSATQQRWKGDVDAAASKGAGGFNVELATGHSDAATGKWKFQAGAIPGGIAKIAKAAFGSRAEALISEALRRK